MNGLEKWHPEQRKTEPRFMSRMRNGVILAVITSTSSFLVVVFAFLLPSFQDQFDRWETRKIINHYEKIGTGLFNKNKYTEAEQVFERAFEFSGNRRLDLDMLRIKSRIFKIYEKSEWLPVKYEAEELNEGDFLFLIESSKNSTDKAIIMSAYGIYLGLKNEKQKALSVLLEAKKLDPTNIIVLVNLGNLYADLNQLTLSKDAYLQAIKIDPNYYEALYDLGVLFYNQNQCEEARKYLEQAFKIDPAGRKDFKNCL